LNVSNHQISSYIDAYSEPIVGIKPHLITFSGTQGNVNDIIYSESIAYPVFKSFVDSNDTCIYVTTNLFYDIAQVTEADKEFICSSLKFKQSYYDIANKSIPLESYNIIHIRCNDEYFNKEFYSDKLMAEIAKLQWGPNTVILSNNSYITKKIHNLFGYLYRDIIPIHSGNNISSSDKFTDTILDYILLTKASKIHCFSYYHHGSGFSEQCAVLYTIPYVRIFLTETDIFKIDTPVSHHAIMDYKYILYQYNKCLEWPTLHIPTDNYTDIYNTISFITLTNTGYLDYTINCLESLEQINSKIPLHSYCIGKEGYTILVSKGYTCTCIDDEYTSFTQYGNKHFSNITYNKFVIIYENLIKYAYVCFTDGDIVFEKNTVFDFLCSHIGDNDLLIQSEGIEEKDLCTGFMFIRSNDKTRSIFNPARIENMKHTTGWDDQVYINSIRHMLTYKRLPLSFFPTGKYYYAYHKNIDPYLIHFNWTLGHEKKRKMIAHKKWYMKVKICQYGSDGFGHQLEGMLRLLSLDINNKAEYQYAYNRKYTFEHTNYDLAHITNYLKTALHLLSDSKSPDTKSYAVQYNEQRSFEDILTHDANCKDTIYLYDGVCATSDKLPPNFENKYEIVRSLPLLRMAFVEKNTYLPPPSYDTKYTNVCCHIRLGDAVGQRLLDNENIYKVIQQFQKDDRYRVIVHSDGDVHHLEGPNTVLYPSTTDVLQVFSDFVHSDILIMNYSSLSIAAHLLADTTQQVFIPSQYGKTFPHRVLEKCISVKDVYRPNLTPPPKNSP
jgi:hypothetical protein